GGGARGPGAGKRHEESLRGARGQSLRRPPGAAVGAGGGAIARRNRHHRGVRRQPLPATHPGGRATVWWGAIAPAAICAQPQSEIRNGIQVVVRYRSVGDGRGKNAGNPDRLTPTRGDSMETSSQTGALFAQSERSRVWMSRVREFIEQHIYPVILVYREQSVRIDRWTEI